MHIIGDVEDITITLDDHTLENKISYEEPYISNGLRLGIKPGKHRLASKAHRRSAIFYFSTERFTYKCVFKPSCMRLKVLKPIRTSITGVTIKKLTLTTLKQTNQAAHTADPLLMTINHRLSAFLPAEYFIYAQA